MKEINLTLLVTLVVAFELAQPGFAVTLEQLDEPSQLTVSNLAGDSHNVNFSATDSVAQLRAKVASLEGVQPERLLLVFAGKQLEDERLLSDYGLKPNSRIISVPQASATKENNKPRAPPIERLTVTTIAGESFEVPANDAMTVRHLKMAIRFFEKDMALDRQQLTFNGATLEDPKTLAECGLRDRSSLVLTISAQTGPDAKTTSGKPMTEAERAQFVSSVVAKFNGRERRAKINFRHDAQLARLDMVERLINERLRGMLERKREMAPLWVEIYRSDDLLVEFGYEFRGKRSSTITNLSAGAEWVADQAQAALDQEAAGSKVTKPGMP